MKGKLLITVPVEPNGSVHWRLADFLTRAKIAEGPKRDWQIEYTYHQGKPICSTRNQQTTAALKTDATAVLFIDDDAVPDPDGLHHLLDALERDDVDVVGGFSLMSDGSCPGTPVVTKPATDDDGMVIDHELLDKPLGLYRLEAGALGAHCLAVKRHVLEAMRDADEMWWVDEFFGYDSGDKAGTRRWGHDYRFCLTAQSGRFNDGKGYSVWVDTRVFWGHVKPVDLKVWLQSEQKLYREIASHIPVVDVMRDLWGNRGWTANEILLLRMANEAMRMPEDLIAVECGSGLSTMVLHRILGPDRLVTLEEDCDHAIAMRERIPNTNGMIRHAPLHDYGEYDWYEKPDLNGQKVGLVFCDGPRHSTRGGRFGALPVLKPHLADEFQIILDDVQRKSETATVQRWCDSLKAEGYEASIQKVPDGDKAFAVIEARKET